MAELEEMEVIVNNIVEKALDEFIYEGKSLREWMNLVDQIPKWIPVTKRLPKPGELDGDVDKYYLVQHESGDMTVARYAHSEHWGNYWEQIFTDRPIAGEIVAWMPLPEEYKPESEVEE